MSKMLYKGVCDMRKTLNVGLVGYKFMGKAHSNAYRQLGIFFDASADVTLKAICGREAEALKKAADQFGFESCETSWEALIGRTDIDIIDITSPSNYHKQVAVAAANAKKHVFCEKPLALNASDAKEMLQAAKDNGIKHQIGFNYRFAPAVLAIKNLIASGQLGTIFHFRGRYLQDFIIDPSFPLIWRLDKNVAGSGALGDLGAHVIDLARFLVGEFDNVCGMCKTFIKQRPIVENMTGLSGSASQNKKMGDVTVDDAAAFMIEFENGAIGHIEASRFAAGSKNALSFEINGSKGSVRFALERLNEFEYYNEADGDGYKGFRTILATEPSHKYIDRWWPAGHIIGYEHTFVHEFYEFVEAITNDTETSPDFYDGYKCCQILDAVEASAKERVWVKVSEI